MAKMYYGIDEVCQNFGLTAGQVKKLVCGGKLREFRDAGVLYYRVDELDQLKAEHPEDLAAFADSVRPCGAPPEESAGDEEPAILDFAAAPGGAPEEGQASPGDEGETVALVLEQMGQGVADVLNSLLGPAPAANIGTVIKSLHKHTDYPLPEDPAKAAALLGVETDKILALAKIWTERAPAGAAKS